MKTTIFGTDGIRGKVGQKPITYEDIITIGKAISQWAQLKYGKNPKIFIAHDTRESCDVLKAALKTGLLIHPVNVYDGQIVPTPAVVSIIQKIEQFDCGIVISASHNQYQDNGIKIIDAKSGKLDKTDEEKISEIFNTLITKKNTKDSYMNFGSDFNWHQAEEKYRDLIINYFEKNLLHGLKIVVDCANGATYKVGPKIFEKLGADTVAIYNTPNGKNINKNCGSLFPQVLQKTVLKHKADIGFAFDGDGDRIIAVNKFGQIKDGDDILAILSDNPLYKHEKTIVGTLVSNYGLETHLKNKKKKLIRTKVGDKFVAKSMQENNLLLGGEQSGHIIMRNYLCTSDGIFAALKIIETMKETDNWEMETFKKCPQALINIPFKEKKDLKTQPFEKIIKENENKLPNGRIIVRYSGTEDVLRVIVEEQNHGIAHKICVNLSHELKKELLK